MTNKIHIDQNGIEKLTSIDETCVSFEPALSPEIIKLLTEPAPSSSPILNDRKDKLLPRPSTLDEHELALA